MDLDCCFILITFIYGFTLVVVDLYYVPFPLHNPTFTKRLVNRSLALIIGMKPCSNLQLTTTESLLFVVLKLSITYIQFTTFFSTIYDVMWLPPPTIFRSTFDPPPLSI